MTTKKTALQTIKERYRKELEGHLAKYNPRPAIDEEVRKLTTATFNLAFGIDTSWGAHRPEFISDNKMTSGQRSLHKLIIDAMQPVLLEFIADVKVAMPKETMSTLRSSYKAAFQEAFKWKLNEALRQRAQIDADKAVKAMMDQLNLDEALTYENASDNKEEEE